MNACTQFLTFNSFNKQKGDKSRAETFVVPRVRGVVGVDVAVVVHDSMAVVVVGVVVVTRRAQPPVRIG